jgi:hypothetical protein
LREQGFAGSDRRVRRWIRQYHRPDRKGIAFPRTAAPLLPSSRQITWIVPKISELGREMFSAGLPRGLVDRWM